MILTYVIDGRLKVVQFFLSSYPFHVMSFLVTRHFCTRAEHPNTKALLSHGGLNGMYEAAYHGLPMVGIPLFADQFDNMERAVARGMALQLDMLTLTEEALSEAVTRVVEDPR